LPILTSRAEYLDVEQLGVERDDVGAARAAGAAWLACVEFSGLIRESTERGAVPFRELWMLAAAKDGTLSWRLARQQALF